MRRSSSRRPGRRPTRSRRTDAPPEAVDYVAWEADAALAPPLAADAAPEPGLGEPPEAAPADPLALVAAEEPAKDFGFGGDDAFMSEFLEDLLQDWDKQMPGVGGIVRQAQRAQRCGARRSGRGPAPLVHSCSNPRPPPPSARRRDVSTDRAGEATHVRAGQHAMLFQSVATAATAARRSPTSVTQRRAMWRATVRRRAASVTSSADAVADGAR